jgi:RNA polymerase sigma-70 factor (ECF subfamily)
VRQQDVTDMDVSDFEVQRPRLVAIATRVLGSAADADEVVQEAWLRLARTAAVDDPPAWLTTVVTRLCLDALRRRRTRSEFEASVPADPQPVDPEADALLAERVGGAVQVVLDALAPAERAAFVLHDVFGYPFDDIAVWLGRSGTAVRKLASRARSKVRGTPEVAAERAARAESRRVVDAFLAAARGGEVPALLALLAPEAVMHADPAGRRMGAEPVYDGAAAVAARFGNARGAAPATIDGDAGAAWTVGGAVRVAFAFHVRDGLVREIELIADPDVLAGMDVVPAG